MSILVRQKQNIVQENTDHLRVKAALFDELVDLIEDKYLGYLMQLSEEEQEMSLAEFKRRIR